MFRFLASLDERLAPLEDLFFLWLFRVALAALLAGSAWIDDAPPLELAAFLVTLYMVTRVIMQTRAFYNLAPFSSRTLKAATAMSALLVLGLSFLTVVTFVFQLAYLAVE